MNFGGLTRSMHQSNGVSPCNRLTGVTVHAGLPVCWTKWMSYRDLQRSGWFSWKAEIALKVSKWNLIKEGRQWLGLKTASLVYSKGVRNQLVWPQEQCPPCLFLLVAKGSIRQDGACCYRTYPYPLHSLVTSSASLTQTCHGPLLALKTSCSPSHDHHSPFASLPWTPTLAVLWRGGAREAGKKSYLEQEGRERSAHWQWTLTCCLKFRLKYDLFYQICIKLLFSWLDYFF